MNNGIDMSNEEKYKDTDKKPSKDNKNKKKHKRLNGYKIANIVLVIFLSVAVLGVGILYTTSRTYMNLAESSYNKAYNQLVMDINNLEANLSKTFVANTPTMQIRTLSDVTAIAVSAENDLASLPTDEENEKIVSKFFNQLSDYTKYLTIKVSKGEQLNDKERENLKKLYDINLSLKSAINESYTDNIAEEKPFSKGILMRSEVVNPLDLAYNMVDEGSIEYPTLIYDGPFSDEKEKAENELSDKGVTESEAMDIVIKAFKELKDVRSFGEINTEDTSVYSFGGKMDNREVYIQVAKDVGKVVLYTSYREVTEEKISEEDAIEKGLCCSKQLGYENIKEVWKTKSNGILTVNYAGIQDDVIIYSELVKVQIALDNGDIIGLEGIHYLTDVNKSRDLTPELSESEARKIVSDKLEISSTRLTVIPLNGNEKLAYEFVGTYEGMKFYVYIDADTGEELQTLRVIVGTEGEETI